MSKKQNVIPRSSWIADYMGLQTRRAQVQKHSNECLFVWLEVS